MILLHDHLVSHYGGSHFNLTEEHKLVTKQSLMSENNASKSTSICAHFFEAYNYCVTTSNNGREIFLFTAFFFLASFFKVTL